MTLSSIAFETVKAVGRVAGSNEACVRGFKELGQSALAFTIK